MTSALVFAGAANADFVLQTFSGTASASVAISRANLTGGDGFVLNYNSIAGGKSTMDVGMYAEILGDTKNTDPNNPTTFVNKGTYSANYSEGSGGNKKYYNNYYGGYTGTGSGSTAVDNYRAWSSSASFGANLQNTGLNLSSSAQYDTGVADWTKVRYTNNTYGTVTSYGVNYRSDASQAGNQGGTSLTYDAVAGQSMDLSASTGFTAIELKGSGTAWATQGEVDFRFNDVSGGFSLVTFYVGNNQLMSDYSVTVADLLSSNAGLDLSQITSIGIEFNAQGFVNADDTSSPGTGSSGITGNNSGFSYNASQVNLVGYAVPAPGAVALIGLAGLVASRRRQI